MLHTTTTTTTTTQKKLSDKPTTKINNNNGGQKKWYLQYNKKQSQQRNYKVNYIASENVKNAARPSSLLSSRHTLSPTLFSFSLYSIQVAFCWVFCWLGVSVLSYY